MAWGEGEAVGDGPELAVAGGVGAHVAEVACVLGVGCAGRVEMVAG